MSKIAGFLLIVSLAGNGVLGYLYREAHLENQTYVGRERYTDAAEQKYKTEKEAWEVERNLTDEKIKSLEIATQRLRNSTITRQGLVAYAALPVVRKEGIITGRIGYPSDGTPSELVTCAIETTKKVVYCSTERVDGMRYKLTVPAGTYVVGSYFQHLSSRYYSESMQQEIPVTVKRGQTVEADTLDWDGAKGWNSEHDLL